MSVDKFKVWLKKELEIRDWSLRELARQAGGTASHTHTNLILKGERSLTWDYCAAIARAFGYSPVEVFKVAGLLENNGSNGSDDIEAIAGISKTLPDDKKAELLKYARYLLSE